MFRPLRLLATIACAVTLLVQASQADITLEDGQRIEKLRYTPVLSSDGRLVGLIEGAKFRPETTSLFLKPNSSNFLHFLNRQIVVRSKNSALTLVGNQIIIDADSRRLRSKASVFEPDDEIVRIYLP